MHFLPLLLSLTTSALVRAIVIHHAPIEQPPTFHGSAEFFFCNNAEYEGLCYKDISTSGECVTVQDDLLNIPHAFGDSVSSVSFNQGFHCILYRDPHCTGTSLTVHYPGVHNLASTDFNDKMSSYQCHYGQ